MKKELLLEREPHGCLTNLIKNMDSKFVEDSIKKLNLKTKPSNHQMRSLLVSTIEDTYLFALDMGLGKTKLALDIISYNKKINGKASALISCSPVVLPHLKKECFKHSNLTCLLINPESSKADKIYKLLNSSTEIVLVSHAWLATLLTSLKKDNILSEKLKKRFSKFDILIADEAHSIRNPTSQGFAFYVEYLLIIKKRYLMTGTPAGNDYTGIWALYYLLDKGLTYGTSYKNHLKRFFYPFLPKKFRKSPYYIQLARTKHYLKESTKLEFFNLFWGKVIRYQEHECNDLPDKSYIRMDVGMSQEQAAAYDNMLKDNDGDTDNIDFELMKITAGIGFKNSYKLNALIRLIEKTVIESSKKLIVWCWLREESDYLLEKLNNHFKKLSIGRVNGSTTKEEKEKTLSKWRNYKLDVLIANQKSLGIGIDLLETNVCCYYSNNKSLIDRKQSEKRIHRKGQNKKCFYFDLVAEDTVDAFNLRIIEKALISFDSLTKDTSKKEESFYTFEDLKNQRITI